LATVFGKEEVRQSKAGSANLHSFFRTGSVVIAHYPYYSAFGESPSLLTWLYHCGYYATQAGALLSPPPQDKTSWQ